MEREFLGVWIPREIYLNKDLTPTEKLLLAEIMSFSKNGVCFASNEHFAEFLGISKGHVSKLVTRLTRLNLISVDITYKEGTKEVDKRVITPILIQEHTPTLSGVDPLLAQEHTPTHAGVDPLLVNEYYKEQDKIQIKEQVKKQVKVKREKHMLNSSELEREFETLWKLYPRKEGKKKAFDSFIRARKTKKISYEIIENGLYRYLRHIENNGTEEQYIMHGSTWFNQEKWQDEYIITGVARKPKSPLEMYRMEFGVNEYEFGGNAQVFDYHEGGIPEYLQGNSAF